MSRVREALLALVAACVVLLGAVRTTPLAILGSAIAEATSQGTIAPAKGPESMVSLGRRQSADLHVLKPSAGPDAERDATPRARAAFPGHASSAMRTSLASLAQDRAAQAGGRPPWLTAGGHGRARARLMVFLN